MLRTLIRLLLWPAAFALGSNPAWAEGMDVRFSGYGTLAATYADTTLGQYRSTLRQDKGSQNNVDFGVDSRFGGQVNLTFNDTFSAAAQVLALRRDGRERVEMEWLYGQIELNEELSARVGRLALPAFMLSDVRNVGYAQHWVRPPTEAYFGFPISSIDGAQLLYRKRWQGATFTAQGSVGQADAMMYVDGGPLGLLCGPCLFRDLRSLNLSAERGPWTLRFGETRVHAYQQWTNAPFLPPEDFGYRLTSLGLQYDNSALLVMAERIDGKTSNGRYDIQGHYLSAGYRIGNWLPYVTRSWLRNIGSAVVANPPSSTTALGLRWDAFDNVAFKAQAERSSLSGQQFVNVSPDVDKRRRVSIYTFAVEFVF